MTNPGLPADVALSLFRPGARAEERPLPYSAPAYKTLDRRAGPMWDEVRSTLDSWFQHLPEAAQAQIRRRFSSPDLGSHLGAFWELYLHEAFRRLEFEVDVDIGNDSSSERRPDLLVSRNGLTFYVEATAVLGDDLLTSQQRADTHRIYDLINQSSAPDFLIDLEIEEYGERTPGRADITDPIESWLSQLDADQLLEREHNAEALETLPLSFDGWQILLTAIPLSETGRGNDDHLVLGSYSEGFGPLDDISPLQRKLRKKAGHYGELDQPYVIAALCAGTFVDDHDINGALFGKYQMYFDPRTRKSSWKRERKGVWMGPRGPINTRVSAVITATGLSPYSVAETVPRWWNNPWTKLPIDVDLPWHRAVADRAGAVSLYDTSAKAYELFELREHWPAVRSE